MITTNFTCDICGEDIGKLPSLYTFTSWGVDDGRAKLDLCQKCGGATMRFILKLKKEAAES